MPRPGPGASTRGAMVLGVHGHPGERCGAIVCNAGGALDLGIGTPVDI